MTSSTDAELVRTALDGDRGAFNAIVHRYQVLVCSLAYSTVGDFALSEDLAQKTFLAAWRQLEQLEDPTKLRSWLCGIVRNLSLNARRAHTREPSHAAEGIENALDIPSTAPTPAESATSIDEAALVWHSLREIPEIYREPLILFYREQRSTRQIAEALDLPDDTIRQRLSRGRKLLRDEVASLIEETLQKTLPGPGFTSGVMAVLPAIDLSIRLGAKGAIASKGIAAMKTAAAVSAAVPWIGDLLVLGLNLFIGKRDLNRLEANLPEARRERLRKYRRDTRSMAIGFVLLFFVIMGWAAYTDQTLLSLLTLLNVYMVALVAIVAIRGRNYIRKSRAETSKTIGLPRPDMPLIASEYRSRMCLFGLPLVHLVRHRIGGTEVERNAPVKAWIASAPLVATSPRRAFGILYAQGRFACAPLSLGFIALGVLPLGIVAFGILTIGALAAGWWSIGWVAFGWESIGVFSTGARAAKGLWSWAGSFADGEGATAPHVNDASADAFFHKSPFFHTVSQFLHTNGLLYLSILLGVCALIRRFPFPTLRRRN